MKLPGDPLSASEVDLYRKCERKWAARYAWDEWPRDDSPIATLSGTALHEIAERYLRDGTQPDRYDALGALFLEGLPYLPAPGSGLTEGRKVVDVYGLPFTIVSDWSGPGSALNHTAPRAVIDHKSSADPKRYGIHTEAKALDDPQHLIYGADATRDADSVLMRWIYYRKTRDVMRWERERARELGIADAETCAKYEGKIERAKIAPSAMCSDFVLTKDTLKAHFDSVVRPAAERIIALRAKGKINPLTLAPNPAHCEEYGGCPHRSRCNLTPEEQLRGAYKAMEGKFDLFAKLPPINGPTEVAAAPAAGAPAHAAVHAPPAAPAFPFAFPPAPVAAKEHAPMSASPAPSAPIAPPVSPALAAPSVPLGVQADAMQAAYYSEVLHRIGLALIAAGRVLAGEGG